jgi:hypothetical protein
MKRGLEVKWWEWLLLAVVVESLIPTKRGLKWEWLVLAGVLFPFV